MNAMTRRIVIGTAAVSMALSMAACGKAGGSKSSDSSSKGDKTIGLLLPENATTRYEKFDRPLIQAKIKALCSDCIGPVRQRRCRPAEAGAAGQRHDCQEVKVLILDPQDSVGIQSSVQAAVDAGIKVVAYDRLAQGPVSAYVSYDNEKVGELQGQALLDRHGPRRQAELQDRHDRR